MELTGTDRKFLKLQDEAGHTLNEVKFLMSELAAAKRRLGEKVREHQRELTILLEERLKEARSAWCTRCHGLCLTEEAQLMLLSGVGFGVYGREDPNETKGSREFANFHRLCPKCAGWARENNGRTGQYAYPIDKLISFYANRVERRADGYYVQHFVAWVKLDGKLPEPPFYLVKELAEKFKLPPILEIEIEEDNNTSELRLVIDLDRT